jgi:hypothetical protein
MLAVGQFGSFLKIPVNDILGLKYCLNVLFYITSKILLTGLNVLPALKHMYIMYVSVCQYVHAYII